MSPPYTILAENKYKTINDP